MPFEESLHFVAILVASGTVCILYLLRASRRISLPDIRGPKSSSFWLGNEGDIKYQNEVGDVEFAWMNKYGAAWKTSGCLGEERLSIVDPRALQHVLTAGYRYPKTADYQGNIRLVMGDGLVWAHGSQHRRQRKVMNQSFSVAQVQSFLPLFLRYADKIVQQLRSGFDDCESSDGPIINVQTWLARATLDVIGEAGFNFKFGALENIQNPVSDMYDNLVRDSTLYPHKWDIVFRSTWKYWPPSLLRFVRYLPGREYRSFRRYQNFIRAEGRAYIRGYEGKPEGNDIISVLRRANEAEEGALQLSELEVVDQISTLLLAGHDTVASTMTWFFYELSKNTDWQTRVREEIKAVCQQVVQRGDSALSAGDLQKMVILQATLKARPLNQMRLHPIVWQLPRVAGQDDVIPLANPITTESGNLITSIPVLKGQIVDIRISAYNRNPAVWGTDAEEWNPVRFMDSDKQAAGLRRCIGYRFAILEMQAIGSTLLEAFEFSLPQQTPENVIERKPSGIMLPMSSGHQGSWMGLRIKQV